MDKRKAIALAVILPCFLLLIGTAIAAPAQLEIEWRVIAGGGGQMEAFPYKLDSSIGQALVGVVNLAPYNLCSGYWCSAAPSMGMIYLPVMHRDGP